jgi:hypothetical protein
MLQVFGVITIYMRKLDETTSSGVKISQVRIVFSGFAIKPEGT